MRTPFFFCAGTESFSGCASEYYGLDSYMIESQLMNSQLLHALYAGVKYEEMGIIA